MAAAQVRWPGADLSGWAASVPFVIIILVLVVRGRALPLRGDATERPPELGSGHVNWGIVLPGVALAGASIIFVFTNDVLTAVTTTSAVAVIALSLVVVTGYAGQLSLAQYGLAGMGAWIAAKLVAEAAFPFELALIAGVLGAVQVGVLVGLPALRTAGGEPRGGDARPRIGDRVADPEPPGAQRRFPRHRHRYAEALRDQRGHGQRTPERYAVFAFAAFCVLAFLVSEPPPEPRQ